MGWYVAQLGSREHYAAARGLHRLAKLQRMYTDIWWRSGRAPVAAPAAVAELTSRRHAELPDEKVVSWNMRFMADRALARLPSRRRSRSDVFTQFVKTGQSFALRVAEAMSHERIDPATDRLFIFSTGALEAIQYCRKIGMPVILDQLDPAQLDEQTVIEEMQRWPGWATAEGKVPAEYYDRLKEEWQLAERVVVNSEWSRRAVLAAGIDPARTCVIPLAYEPEDPLPAQSAKEKPSGRLHLLWLGQVVLRKGIPYLLEAARKLPRVQFDVVGSIGITDQAVRSAPANVTFHGKLDRSGALAYYRNADLFVLPTLSDGFAITQIEAMSHGLPVITTERCGEVVTPGEDGFIIPVRSAEALAERIAQLDSDRALLEFMSTNAIKKARSFTIARYTDSLILAGEVVAT
ncbi:glycosyltransferase family 4 protein [soil metagenome]